MNDETVIKNKNDELNEEAAVDISVLAVDFFKGLKKFGWLVVTLALLASAVTYVHAKRNFYPVYSSSATFSITTASSAASANGVVVYSYYYNANSTADMAKVFPYIIKSSLMTDIIKNDLGVSYINGTITAEAQSSTNIFTITVQSGSPKSAYDILNSIINNYPKVADYVLGDTDMRLYIKPELDETPDNSFSYRYDVIKGFAAGALFGLAFVLLYALTRRTVRQRKDITEKLNRYCIAEIPFVKLKRRKSKDEELILIGKKHSYFSEAFRVLRKRTVKELEKMHGNAVAVTSAATGEGKTTTAVNLAMSIAKSGKKVALVDLDLHRKSLQKYLKAGNGVSGLTEVALEEKTIDEVAFRHSEIETLTVYYAGSMNVRYDEALFKPIIEKICSLNDYVVIDTPPCGIVSDAAAILGCADAVLFVVRQDCTPLKKIKSAMLYSSYSSAKEIGFVFNYVKQGFAGYSGYYYGSYKYGSYKYGSYGRYGYGKKAYGGYYGHYGSNEYGYGYGNAVEEASIIEPSENDAVIEETNPFSAGKGYES